MVFNASSKANSKLPSLNDCIHVSPPLIPAILDILLKLGLFLIYSKHFKILLLRHRDYLRFLWINNIYDEDPDVIILRLASVAFGVNVSPFLLNANLQNHIRNYFIGQDFAKKLLDSFYVDDFNSGENKVGDAFQLYQKTKKCLSDGGLHLRK